jgi:hypothetical protein
MPLKGFDSKDGLDNLTWGIYKKVLFKTTDGINDQCGKYFMVNINYQNFTLHRGRIYGY